MFIGVYTHLYSTFVCTFLICTTFSDHFACGKNGQTCATYTCTHTHAAEWKHESHASVCDSGISGISHYII